MKKKNLLFAFYFLLFTVSSRAQLALPYFENFNDDAADGWLNFRESDTVGATWQFNLSAYHEGYFPHGHPGVMLDDWVVSPELDLSTAAKVAFQYQTYTLGSILPGDSIQCYLLSGSRNPSAAGKHLLCNITPDSTYAAHDTIVDIPAVSGSAYIAFRYTATTDSMYAVVVTNIDVTADASTGIIETGNTKYQLCIYPNPATKFIYWDSKLQSIINGDQGEITDIAGKVSTTFSIAKGRLDISTFQPGLYFWKAGNTTSSFIKK
jgi:Secretion system C-terminal sorting domain